MVGVLVMPSSVLVAQPGKPDWAIVASHWNHSFAGSAVQCGMGLHVVRLIWIFGPRSVSAFDAFTRPVRAPAFNVVDFARSTKKIPRDAVVVSVQPDQTGQVQTKHFGQQIVMIHFGHFGPGQNKKLTIRRKR